LAATEGYHTQYAFGLGPDTASTVRVSFKIFSNCFK
jgi:hypothetical protein